MRVLLIDDDVELAVLLREFFEREGFPLAVEYTGERGVERALTGEADVVILDVMLPGIDGFEALRRIRQKSRAPVLMLTARAEDVDRIVGLELGADDYLGKPFNPRELLARIRAVLRRTQAPPAEGGRLEVNGVTLDPGSRETAVDGAPVQLTTLEFDILELLMRAAGRVLSRDSLMESIYGRRSTPFERSIDMHISHLRRKLERGRTFIKTVRGVGYQFARSPGDAVE